VTHIVIPHRPEAGVGRLLRRSLADELLARVPEAELHVVAARL
jgi:hypothetical protein